MSKLTRTTVVDLVVPAVVVGVLAYLLLRRYWDDMPQLHYATAVPLAVLAVIELVLSRRVRAAVRHDPDARPMAAIAIARLVALGKASSLVAAGLIGALAALEIRVLPHSGSIDAARSDSRVGFVLIAACALLLAAGLLLERAGIDPGGTGDENRGPAAQR